MITKVHGAHILITCLLCLSISALASSGQDATTVTETKVRQAPSFQAPAMMTLPKDARVTLLNRQGGWYQVLVNALKGWLPLLSVRLAPIDVGHHTGSGVGKLISTFTSGPKAIAASTGVRGLNAQDIKRARPNFNAVNKMLTFRVTDKAAKTWAKQKGLVAKKLPYLNEEARP